MQIQQTQSANRTKAQLKQYEREILATYEDARLAINAALQKFYADKLTGIKPEDYFNYVNQQDRLPRLKAEIDRLYNEAAKKSGVITRRASAGAMSNTYYQNQYVFEWFTPELGVDLSFTLLPPELIDLSVTGNIERWKAIEAAKRAAITRKFGPVVNFIPKDGETLTALLLGHRTDDIRKINQTISSALFRGQGYQKTAREVSKIIGQVTKDGVTGSKANALRIVRTEGNRTLNAASFANSMQASDQGTPIKRQWAASLDDRTRASHAHLDGEQVDVGEEFTGGSLYPGGFGIAAQDINCRCTVIDVIPGLEPTIRRGRNPNTGENELFEWKDFSTWARDNGLTKNVNGRWI